MFVFHFLRVLMYIPFCLMFPCRIKGRKNLPKGGAIIVCNHTSNIDALMFAAHFWEPFFYLAKKELYKNKFMAFITRNIGGICIDRSINDFGAIKNCLKVLKDGRKLVIFPEGTRVHSDKMELGEIKGGASMLAIKTKLPIVPVYLNRQPRLFRKTVLTVGQPFELSEFYQGKLDSEKQERAGEVLSQKMHQLRQEVIESQSKTRREKRRQEKALKKQGKKA